MNKFDLQLNKLKQFQKSHPKRAYSLYAAIFVLIALSIGLILNRKSSDGLPEAETPADTGALRVSLLPTAENLPLFLAESTRIFDSLGLKMVITDRMAQFDTDTALYGKSAHLASTDLVRLQYQATRGKKAAVLMGLQGTWGIVVAPGQRATNIKVLKDRLLGTSRFSTSDFVGAQALKNAEMDYDNMLRAQANDFSVRTSMVTQAQIESAVLPEPWLNIAVAQKSRAIWHLPEAEGTLGCLAARPDLLKSKRRTAQIELLFKGYNIAVNRINKHGLQAGDTLVAQHYGVPLARLQKMKLPRYKTAALPPAKAIERSRTFLAQRGVKPSATLLMDDRFIKK